jgi:uncharacterized OB-fold protein
MKYKHILWERMVAFLKCRHCGTIHMPDQAKRLDVNYCPECRTTADNLMTIDYEGLKLWPESERGQA